MWDLIAKVFPAHLIAGLVLYGLVCAIWLQPLVEERMANITWIPQCEAGALPDVQAPRMSRSDAGPDTPAIDPPASVLILRELRGIFGTDDRAYLTAVYGQGGSCSCAVGTAYERTFWRSLASVMTLRFYTPRAIEHFNVRIAQVRASGLCG